MDKTQYQEKWRASRGRLSSPALGACLTEVSAVRLLVPAEPVRPSQQDRKREIPAPPDDWATTSPEMEMPPPKPKPVGQTQVALPRLPLPMPEWPDDDDDNSFKMPPPLAPQPQPTVLAPASPPPLGTGEPEITDMDVPRPAPPSPSMPGSPDPVVPGAMGPGSMSEMAEDVDQVTETIKSLERKCGAMWAQVQTVRGLPFQTMSSHI